MSLNMRIFKYVVMITKFGKKIYEFNEFIAINIASSRSQLNWYYVIIQGLLNILLNISELVLTLRDVIKLFQTPIC